VTPAWAAVLVDLGGTLDGDGEHWSHRFDRVFRELGLANPREELDEAFGVSEAALNADPAVSRLSLGESIELQTGIMLRRLGLYAPGLAGSAAARLIDEARAALAANGEVLGALRRHRRVGILSNFTGKLERIVRQEGLIDRVDAVFDSAVVGLRKPDPAFFVHALRSLEARPACSAMVGDSVDMDLRPARSLGLTTIWIEGAPGVGGARTAPWA
jgi:FMN phosphatase YigB (HAD superfamily)